MEDENKPAAEDSTNEETAVEQTNTETPVEQPVMDTVPETVVEAEKPKKSHSKVIALVAAVVLLIGGGVFAALSLMSANSDDTKVLDAIANLNDVESYVLDITFDAQNPNPLGGVDVDAIDVDGSFNVQSDGLMGMLSVVLDESTFSAELFTDQDNLAIKLVGLNDLLTSTGSEDALATGEVDFAEIITPFEGAWVGINIDELNQTGLLPANLDTQVDETEQAQLLDQLNDALNGRDFFDATLLDETKDLNGTSLTGYDVVLDPEETAALFEDLIAALPNSQELADFNSSDLVSAVEEINSMEDFNIIFWIDDTYVRIFEIDASNSQTGAIATATLEFNEINSAPALVAPEFDFNLEDIITAIFSAALGGLEDLQLE